MDTPLGEIEITFDGKPSSYIVRSLEADERLFPDIKGRYFLEIDFIPDGLEHSIACFVSDTNFDKVIHESGEEMDCISLYKDDMKLSVGVAFDAMSGKYDFGVQYLPNGLVYKVLPTTKCSKYIFAVSWVDDLINYPERDIQTWLAADIT